MRFGTLDDIFVGVAWKRLTAHEIDRAVSHGHEFQGVNKLRRLLGADRREYDATYMLLADDEQNDLVIRATAEWYDARENQPHRSPEWRLYYPAAANHVVAATRPNDLLVVALTRDGQLLLILTPSGSTSEAEIQTLFALGTADQNVQLRLFDDRSGISALAGRILEQFGIRLPVPDPVGDGPAVMAAADELLHRYPDALPPGKEVSALIRARLKDVDPVEDPDDALVRWVEAEDTAFRLWEDCLIEHRLEKGFDLPQGGKDVQGFRDFSMKIRQSRVSRAGGALQLHVASVLEGHGIAFESQAITENGERPDFLFPGSAAYKSPDFPQDGLRMLGVKFTAKDRWRQVLNEAARIPRKHLLTLEAPISGNQIAAMTSSDLVPIIPVGYHQAFAENVRPFLRSVGYLVDELKNLQKRFS